MNLTFEKWFAEILAVQKKFNASTDPVVRYAILAALKVDFEKNVKMLAEESERLKTFAVDALLGRKP